MLHLKLPDAVVPGAPHRRTSRPRATSHAPREPRPVAPLVPEAGVGQFELFRDAVVVADIDTGQIVQWNPAAEHLFGYSATESIGRHVESLMPPAVAKLYRLRLEHYRRTGEAAVLNGRAPLEMLAQTSSGAEIRVEMSLAPLGASTSSATVHGGARHILLMFRDATPPKQTELHTLDAVRAQSARANTEARLKMSQDLLPDSVREMDTALARARIAATRLARLAKQDASTRPQRVALMARVVELRTEQVRRALQHITDAAACQAGTFQLDAERVNLVPLLSRVVTATRTRSATHQIRLAAPQGLTALVDGPRIEQVVHELILQAIRRNPRGCWIDVDLRRPLAGVARVEVRDYGRHLSTRERERLPHAPRSDRSWLVIEHIVKQHQGSLSIETLAEGGLRVALTLPTHRQSHV